MSLAKIPALQIERYIRYLFVLLSFIAGVQYYLQGNTVRVVSALLTITLFILPLFILKLLRVTLPVSYRLIYLLFIIAAMYLGELHNFFYRFFWWDELIHTASAMLITYVGLLLVYLLSKDSHIHLRLGAFFTAMIIFCFTMAFGAVWELFEWSVDNLLGLNLLKGRASTDMNSVYDGGRALVNTMFDLSVDMLGAIIVATIAYFQFRSGKANSWFALLIRQFIKENPGLFQTADTDVPKPSQSRQ